MSVVAEFEVMRGKIKDAISGALEGKIARHTMMELQETMKANVYSYQASPWAMSKRRGEWGGLADINLMNTSVTDISTGKHSKLELQVEFFQV